MLRRLFLIVLSCCVFLPPLYAQPTLTLATHITAEDPWIIGEGYDIHHSLPGIEIELYRMAFESLGLKLNIVRMPWKRAMIELERGAVDGLFPTDYDSKRLNIGVFPRGTGDVSAALAVRRTHYYFYKHRDSTLEWDGEHVTGAQRGIVVLRGWSVVADLKKRNIPIVEVSDKATAFKLLGANRVAGTVCAERAAEHFFSHNSERCGSFNKLEPAFKDQLSYLIFSHQFYAAQPQLAEQLWQAIATLRGSYTYVQLLEKYGLRKVKH